MEFSKTNFLFVIILDRYLAEKSIEATKKRIIFLSSKSQERKITFHEK